MTGPGTLLHVATGNDHWTIVGEIDAHTVSVITEKLLSLPDTGDARLDLDGVTFIDSSGIRALLDVHRQMESDGRRLILLRPSSTVTRLLQITGLASHLHTDPPIDPKHCSPAG